jgi:hypothetical protein
MREAIRRIQKKRSLILGLSTHPKGLGSIFQGREGQRNILFIHSQQKPIDWEYGW